MTITVKVLSQPDALAAAARLFRTAMIGLPALAEVDDATLERLFEPGRALGAYLNGSLVGTTNSHGGMIVVPGGRRAPQAAVTHVGVLATAARRGIARAMLSEQLRQARARGDVLASLRATEAGIYVNFGYGLASSTVDLEIDRRHARLTPALAALRAELRYGPPQEIWDLQARIYAAAPDPRPGTIQRPDRWWRGPAARGAAGGQPVHVVTCGPVGAETGYVRYHPDAGRPWVDNTERTVIVDDLIAHDDASYAALVSHLLTVDISHRILMPVRAVDEPLPLMMADCRTVRVTRRLDETWLRVLDVDAALGMRGYRQASAVVIKVLDDILPENSGNWSVGPEGVARTSAAAEVICDISALSSAYLGGTAWWQLAAAGRLAHASAAGIRALDALFSVERQPFAGTMF